MFNNNLFHSDWKPDKISIFSDELTCINGIVYLKLVDFEGTSNNY